MCFYAPTTLGRGWVDLPLAIQESITKSLYNMQLKKIIARAMKLTMNTCQHVN